MGFISGVIAGVAVSAGAAAWYLSRSGERFRDQYRLERRLGEIGDQLEERSREIQATVNAQLAEVRSKANGPEIELDASQASAAEAAAADAAAALAAEIDAGESPTRRTRTADGDHAG